MTHESLLLLILAVGLASYVLRAAPLALLRRPLRNPRLVAFIERLPYAILAAMVVPDVFSSTGDATSSALGFAAALALASHALRSRPRARRAAGFVLIVGYIWGNLSKTILGRRHKPGLVPNFDLFWSYRRSLSLSRHGLHVTSPSLLAEIVLNYLLYFPFGFLLPYMWPKHYHDCGRLRGTLRVMRTACLCSVATECAQQLLRVGFFELDDVFGNTMGAAMGYLLYRLLCDRN